MVRIPLFLSALLILLVGCAEVLPLTGGETDAVAPRPVENSQVPEQGETSFSGNKVSVEFDEYIVLNDPTNTATMNPSAGKLTVTNNKKKVTIAWDGALQPNTTYIIQLNGTIQDLNEKNDTLHQFVFSTGPTIDTLKLQGNVRTAFTDAPCENYTVGLFPVTSNPLTDDATYLCRTNKRGDFKFTYLKEENYKLFAYFDGNKDRKYTIGESYAFLNNPINTTDTLEQTLVSFVERNALNKLQIQYQLPGTALAYGKSLDASKLFINGQNATLLKRFREDSILVALPLFEASALNFIYEQDTVAKLISEKERKQNFQINCINYKKSIREKDTIFLVSNELLLNIDTTQIRLTDSKSNRIDCRIQWKNNQILILPKNISTDKFVITFLPKAIQGPYNFNDSLGIDMEFKSASDLSNLKVNCEVLKGQNWMLQLMDGKTVIATQLKNEADSLVQFINLLPGTYQIRCIQDENRNGDWDPGNYTSGQQPEKVYRFEVKSKMRPNWDIEETLELKTNE